MNGEVYCMGCMRIIRPGQERCPHCQFQLSEYQWDSRVLKPGTRIGNGKYIIGKTLGRGGFGVTYIGLDTMLELRVAIKEYYPNHMAYRIWDSAALFWQCSEDERQFALNSFLREARKMAKIDRISGVVRVREIFPDNNTAYIVMDYIEGETLQARLVKTGRPMIPDECFQYLRPVMDSLTKAHKRGLIHRDIKPDNIMIDENGKIWLLDMGAAKDLTTSVSGMTTSIPAATPGFSPLEQYGNPDGIGAWSDVYAMSATAYYCMSSVTPPVATDRVFNPAFRDFPISLKIPGELAQVLSKGLALKPEDRYQTMAEFENAFESALNSGKSDGKTRKQSDVVYEDMERIYCMGCMRAISTSSGACPYCGFDFKRYKPPEYSLQPGISLLNGRYLIGKTLGKGGLSFIYIALDRDLNQRVAIKEYYPIHKAYRTGNSNALNWRCSESDKRSGIDAFIRAAKEAALMSVVHRIVYPRNLFEENDTVYVVMNYIEGETLLTWLQKNGWMSPDACFRLFQPLMKALTKAHERGLLHRDINPNNIMINTYGMALLLNSDSVGLLFDNDPDYDALPVANGFRSLEEYASDHRMIGPWTDVYAMGATMYYCVSGSVPSPATERIFQDSLRFPDAFPPVAMKVLSKAMELRPQDRYQTMEEFETAFAAALMRWRRALELKAELERKRAERKRGK